MAIRRRSLLATGALAFAPSVARAFRRGTRPDHVPGNRRQDADGWRSHWQRQRGLLGSGRHPDRLHLQRARPMKTIRLALLGTLCAALVFAGQQGTYAFTQGSRGKPPATAIWKPLAIGAGGWLVGMDIAADGTKVVRTDTYGAYLWNGSRWAQLVNATSLPAGDVAVDNNEGVYEIRIAPSNTSRLYMTYLGWVYRSDNQGTTWTKTAFTQIAGWVAGAYANDNYRFYGEKLAVDPANADVVYVGTPVTGLFVSFDAGAPGAH